MGDTRAKRTFQNNSQTDTGSVDILEHNVYSGAKKTLKAGPSLAPIGLLNTEKPVRQGQTIYVYNNAAVVGLVAFGVSGLSAPTTLANGLPVPPNSYACFAVPLGNDITAIRGSAATLGGYLMIDDTTLTEVTKENT